MPVATPRGGRETLHFHLLVHRSRMEVGALLQAVLPDRCGRDPKVACACFSSPEGGSASFDRVTQHVVSGEGIYSAVMNSSRNQSRNIERENVFIIRGLSQSSEESTNKKFVGQGKGVMRSSTRYCVHPPSTESPQLTHGFSTACPHVYRQDLPAPARSRYSRLESGAHRRPGFSLLRPQTLRIIS